MNRMVRLTFLGCLALLSGPVLAQTVVENTLVTATSTGAATGMQGVGKGVAGALEKALGTLDSAVKTAKGSTPRTASPTAVPPPASAPAPIVKFVAPDPVLLKIGMDREELLKNFGEPAMKISGNDGPQAVETWDYGTPPETVTVKLRAGKIESVSSSRTNKKEPAAAALNPYQAGTAVVVLR